MRERDVPASGGVRAVRAIQRDFLVVFSATSLKWCCRTEARQRGAGAESDADLASSPGDVLDAGQRLEAHRAAGMQLLRRHPDLEPVAELAAVGEPGRAVHEHAA